MNYALIIKNKIIENLSLTFDRENKFNTGIRLRKSTCTITNWLYDSSGEILINDKFNLNQLDINKFRNKISYLTQDCVIYRIKI